MFFSPPSYYSVTLLTKNTFDSIMKASPSAYILVEMAYWKRLVKRQWIISKATIYVIRNDKIHSAWERKICVCVCECDMWWMSILCINTSTSPFLRSAALIRSYRCWAFLVCSANIKGERERQSLGLFSIKSSEKFGPNTRKKDEKTGSVTGDTTHVTHITPHYGGMKLFFLLLLLSSASNRYLSLTQHSNKWFPRTQSGSITT